MRDDKFCPVEIEFMDTAGVAKELLDQPEGSHVVLISSSRMINRVQYGQVIVAMKERYHFTWLNKTIANPTQVDVMDAVGQIGDKKPDIIFAIGGGSAIDTAKGISALYDLIQTGASVDTVSEAIESKSYMRNQTIPIVAIPTTAGTGSEVTKWATIWDYKQRAKYSIDMPELYPKKAIIVTEFTMSLPKKLVLATALDAMAHAMEAFWARETSPIVQEISLLAVSKVHRYLPDALKDLADQTAREQLCMASLLAGVAFSNTRTTACHSMSYPMTMEFGIEHGFAVAMTLNEVSRINLTAVPKLQMMLDLFKEDGGLGAWIDSMCDGIVSLRLSAFGIKKEEITKLVQMAFTKGRMNNNPVDLSSREVETILESVF